MSPTFPHICLSSYPSLDPPLLPSASKYLFVSITPLVSPPPIHPLIGTPSCPWDPVVERVGKDTVSLVLWILSAQAGQVGLVAVQTPGVKALPLVLGLVPIRVFYQGRDVGAKVELRPQECRGWAAGEGSTGQSGHSGSEVWGKIPFLVTDCSPGLDSDTDCPWLLSRTLVRPQSAFLAPTQAPAPNWIRPHCSPPPPPLQEWGCGWGLSKLRLTH